MTVERWKELHRLAAAEQAAAPLRAGLLECLDEIERYREANRRLSRSVVALFSASAAEEPFRAR